MGVYYPVVETGTCGRNVDFCSMGCHQAARDSRWLCTWRLSPGAVTGGTSQAGVEEETEVAQRLGLRGRSLSFLLLPSTVPTIRITQDNGCKCRFLGSAA